MLNTSITYSLLLILSTGAKKSFSELGRLVGKSHDTIKRWLQPEEVSLRLARQIAQYLLGNPTELILSIDDTLIKKHYARFMQGIGSFFDTKIGRRVTAYRLLTAAIGNLNYAIPISFGLLFDSTLLTPDQTQPTKLDHIIKFYELATKLFPQTRIKIVADGWFASLDLLTWAHRNNVHLVLRCHRNRKVTYRGNIVRVDAIAELLPKGRQMARTIATDWHDLPVFVTAERRFDKHGDESIVYLIANYPARPSRYVSDYQRRWPTEKIYRTIKQSIGLQDCFARDLVTQRCHIAAVLLSYAIAQLHRRLLHLETPEAAIRALKQQKLPFAIRRLARLDQIFGDVYA